MLEFLVNLADASFNTIASDVTHLTNAAEYATYALMILPNASI